MEDKDITLHLPGELLDRLQAEASKQGKALEELILALLEQKYPAGAGTEAGLSREEEDKVKERLRALGYMD